MEIKAGRRTQSGATGLADVRSALGAKWAESKEPNRYFARGKFTLDVMRKGAYLLIKSFRDKKTEAVFHGTGCDKRWRSFERVAKRKLLLVHAAASLHDLKSPPNNKLEELKKEKERKGQHAIRVNDRYRVCFRWIDGHAYDVEITDYH